MRYLILIHTHEAPWAALDGAEQQKWMQAYLGYVADLRQRDKFVDSGQLHLSNEAKQITVVNGKRTVVDGPFADTKEQVGGFFVVEAADEVEAIELAAACPGAQHGRIELRQLRQR
ncbi:YciI family protein [Terricaulis sp.]|uniref:YciI family protein n=1 Tax=Terricaulis sp. TaxID=2768686 RepID=UPI003784E364